jgi:hypothetical protein
MDSLVQQKDGWTEKTTYSDSDKSCTIHLSADVQDTIDDNKRLFNMNDGYSKSREWRRVASIPLIVVELWKKQYGVNPMKPENSKLLKRLLNDPDLRGLRTAPGEL